jgi:hypothetical protein
MKRPVAFSLVLAALMFQARGVAFAQAVNAPPGWTSSQQGTDWIYKLTTLSGTETLTLTVQPPQALGGKDLNEWLAFNIKKDSARRGTVVSSQDTENKLLGIREVFRSYRDVSGLEWQVSYIAFPLHGHQALFCYIATNLPPSDTAGDYFGTAGKICGVIARNAEKRSSPVGSSH